MAAYLPHGPHKRDLDRVSGTKPIFLYDNSGHSVWVNSALLRMLGIDRNTPDVSTNLSHFVRDGNGEPTGWIKEFALTPYMGAFAPDAGALKARLLKYLNYMSSRGITTVWDAGNFNMDDAVYRAAHAIAKDGDLPLRWEGSYHIWAPEQIDTAAQETMLDVPDPKAFLLSEAHGRILIIIGDWYRDRYGGAVDDDDTFVSMILVHGTPFPMVGSKEFQDIRR